MNRLGFLIGLAFGFVLAGTRLSDYDVIHRMLLLQEPDVFLLMASAVAVAAPLLWLLQRRRWQTPLGGPLHVRTAPVRRNNVLGAMLFGTGWAVAGTCRGPAVVMTAAGSPLGLPGMGGLMTGTLLYDAKTARPAASGSPAPGTAGLAHAGEQGA